MIAIVVDVHIELELYYIWMEVHYRVNLTYEPAISCCLLQERLPVVCKTVQALVLGCLY